MLLCAHCERNWIRGFSVIGVQYRVYSLGCPREDSKTRSIHLWCYEGYHCSHEQRFLNAIAKGHVLSLSCRQGHVPFRVITCPTPTSTSQSDHLPGYGVYFVNLVGIIRVRVHHYF